jgi:DNA-binding transcriptional ArsR family regulator
MTKFLHPSKDDITLNGVLAALSDPIRLQILKSLLQEKGCMSCCAAAPKKPMAKSTLSHHFRILREAGLIRTSKRGVENRNELRLDEINEKFPGLLKMVMKFAD